MVTKKKTEEERLPMGRPIEYDPAMCQKAVELGKLGKSVTAIAVELGVAKSTVYDWAEIYPDFSYAIRLARDAAQKWFEDKGNDHIIETHGGPRLNTTWAMFQMKNRFREQYGDQPQVVINKTEETKIPDEVKDKLDALESKIRENGNGNGNGHGK